VPLSPIEVASYHPRRKPKRRMQKRRIDQCFFTDKSWLEQGLNPPKLQRSFASLASVCYLVLEGICTENCERPRADVCRNSQTCPARNLFDIAEAPAQTDGRWLANGEPSGSGCLPDPGIFWFISEGDLR
jgi:hypothetical protein